MGHHRDSQLLRLVRAARQNISLCENRPLIMGSLYTFSVFNLLKRNDLLSDYNSCQRRQIRFIYYTKTCNAWSGQDPIFTSIQIYPAIWTISINRLNVNLKKIELMQRRSQRIQFVAYQMRKTEHEWIFVELCDLHSKIIFIVENVENPKELATLLKHDRTFN